jgi:hypothetical protein
MSKGIKYRAFVERFKKMYDIKIIDFIKEKVYFDEDTYRHFNEIDLMQYTGLLDIDGKEIYEGDIVRINNKTEDIGKVLFEDYGFSIETADDSYWLSDFLSKDLFVLGNIYENPELLGEQE